MNRFFVDKNEISTTEARIIGEDVKHISKVLRMQESDKVMLSDGEGNEYLAEISRIAKDEVLLKVLTKQRCEAEPKRRVTLYQGLPKAGKMELIIQKCVELGIARIVPVMAERSVVRLKNKEFEPKRIRYQRVAYEAAKQSGRGVIPEIGALTAFAKADFSAHDLIIVAYEEERDKTLKSLLQESAAARDIALIIGPEGGLEPCEVQALCESGGESVTLGKRILRTETAGMAVLSMILYELEG